MKIVIEMLPDKDNNEMVQFKFKLKGKPESMSVHRATARMGRVIAQTYAEMLAETEHIQEQLEVEEILL